MTVSLNSPVLLTVVQLQPNWKTLSRSIIAAERISMHTAVYCDGSRAVRWDFGSLAEGRRVLSSFLKRFTMGSNSLQGTVLS